MTSKGKTNVLLLGNGGREHAIAWKLAQSPHLDKLLIAPGNAGTAEVGTNVQISLEDPIKLLEYAQRQAIGLTVVGPEAPLALGVVNIFREAGLPIFGPTREAAMLETSKAYAKEVMVASGVPTANYQVFTEYETAEDAISNWDFPLVIKVDGLAAGKGVIICENNEETLATLKEIFIDNKFGGAGQKVLIEEFLIGQEISAFSFVDGENVSPIIGATDYKRAYDGDKGPNTGGMGSYSPPKIWNKDIENTIKKNVFEPVIGYMRSIGNPYTGVLYAGLIVTSDGIKVLEFNCRFGDPETQVLLPRMETDLLSVMQHVAMSGISGVDIKWDPRPCVGLVVASDGYPASYNVGKKIKGLDQTDTLVNIFHAGTSLLGDETLTSGGRVLAVTAMSDSFENARELIYKNVEQIDFEGMIYRKDIGSGL
ncbi:MAG: phosphoribosylamine--glycine ligase [Chloroflexi bacterium]|jgi:phosphoribosylamine--glycine ligase|nr:MAG: phosphoribosylamine--glycine ligase [Chloroflexota bacterium]